MSEFEPVDGHETMIFEFGGWLTTRPGLLEVGDKYSASPMAEAIEEFITMKRGKAADIPPPHLARPDDRDGWWIQCVGGSMQPYVIKDQGNGYKYYWPMCGYDLSEFHRLEYDVEPITPGGKWIWLGPLTDADKGQNDDE